MIRFSLSKRLHSQAGPMDLAIEAEIPAGETLALSGPSGAGKTSVLRMLAGLMRPDAGRIEAFGETWFDSAAGVDWPARRRRAGMVFQDYALFPNMTVRGNLEYAQPRPDPAAADAMLRAMGLDGLADRRPASLSGGQKQRTALARALLAGPRILLLDEPLSALDQSLRARLQDEIAALPALRALAALLVSHDTAEILRLARRVARIEQGRVVETGAPARVFGGSVSGGLRVPGLVLACEVTDGIPMLTVLAGERALRVPAPEGRFRPGDKVLLAADGPGLSVLPPFSA